MTRTQNNGFKLEPRYLCSRALCTCCIRSVCIAARTEVQAVARHVCFVSQQRDAAGAACHGERYSGNVLEISEILRPTCGPALVNVNGDPFVKRPLSKMRFLRPTKIARTGSMNVASPHTRVFPSEI